MSENDLNWWIDLQCTFNDKLAPDMFMTDVINKPTNDLFPFLCIKEMVP